MISWPIVHSDVDLRAQLKKPAGIKHHLPSIIIALESDIIRWESICCFTLLYLERPISSTCRLAATACFPDSRHMRVLQAAQAIGIEFLLLMRLAEDALKC